MKKTNIFIEALRLRLKPRNFVTVKQLYFVELAGLIGLVILWDAWNPILATAAYLIGSRSIQYILRRHANSQDLRKYRTALDGIAGLAVIILGLLYTLNNYDRLGRLINPNFSPDEAAVAFALELLMVLTVIVTIYLVLRVYAGLRKPRPYNPWSDNWLDKLLNTYATAESFIAKLFRPLLDFRISSYSRLSLKEKFYIWLRGLIFPIGVLVPYFLTRTEYKYCSLRGSCITSQGSGAVQNILILAFLLIIIIVSLLRDGPRNHQAFKRFVSWQIVISMTSFALTLLTYRVMFPFSQGSGREIVMVIGDQITLQHKALFGTGLPGGMVAGLSIFYLLLPVIRWYRVLFSPKYIDGIKKQELFQ